jgi:hypothetical protein
MFERMQEKSMGRQRRVVWGYKSRGTEIMHGRKRKLETGNSLSTGMMVRS